MCQVKQNTTCIQIEKNLFLSPYYKGDNRRVGTLKLGRKLLIADWNFLYIVVP